MMPDARRHNRTFTWEIPEKQLELVREALHVAADALTQRTRDPQMAATKVTKLRRQAVQMRLLAVDVSRRLKV